MLEIELVTRDNNPNTRKETENGNPQFGVHDCYDDCTPDVSCEPEPQCGPDKCPPDL